MTTLHEQARAEAEKRMPGRLVELVGDLEYNVQAARMRKAFVEGAGWAATRTRVVTTVTELDALPHGTALLTPRGLAEMREGALGKYVRRIDGAEEPWGFWGRLLPARVLYDPEEAR